ncbi:MAG: hypothetical protein KDB46_06770 [Solirubrobacterales bacterium]|nr:hypothetical protein [Solirubrobacterales bacterium]
MAVVPESSERFTGVIALSGRSASGIVGGDLRVVPVRDLLGEDPGERLRRELEALDLGEVVDDRDRRDVDRDLDQLAALVLAALVGAAELAALEGRVGPAVVGAAGDELLTAAARADRVVGDRHVGVVVLDAGDPGLLGGLLGARTGSGDLA